MMLFICQNVIHTQKSFFCINYFFHLRLFKIILKNVINLVIYLILFKSFTLKRVEVSPTREVDYVVISIRDKLEQLT